MPTKQLGSFTDTAGNQLLAYAGVWAPYIPYYKGDVVSYNGALYESPTDQPGVVAPLTIGAVNVANSLAGTTTTAVPLPAGCRVGDLLVACIMVTPNVNGGIMTRPTWATGAMYLTPSTAAATYQIATFVAYQLLAADVANGFVAAIPIQNAAPNDTANTHLYANGYVFRGPTGVLNLNGGLGSLNTGTTPGPASATAAAAPNSPFTLFWITAAGQGGGANLPPVWQATTPIPLGSQQIGSPSGTSHGVLASCYAATSAATAGAAAHATWTTSVAYSVNEWSLTLNEANLSTAPTTFVPANWTQLTGPTYGNMMYDGALLPATNYLQGAVCLYNGMPYVAQANVSTPVTPVSLGATTAANASTKTTTTALAIPVAAIAGDIAVVSVALFPVTTTPATTQLAQPTAWAPTLQGITASGQTGDAFVYAAYTYTLLAADITRGNLPLPAQPDPANDATSSLQIVGNFYRGVSVENAQIVAPSVTTSTTPSTVTNGLNPTAATYAVFAMVAAFLTATTSAWSYAPLAQTTSAGVASAGAVRGWVEQMSATLNGNTIVPAETLSMTLSASEAWCTAGAQITLIAPPLLDTTKWTPLIGGGGAGQVLTKRTGATGDYAWRTPAVTTPNQWNYIGAPGGVPWGAPGQVGTNWSNYDGGIGFGPAGFIVDGKGKFRMSGLISGGAGGQPICVLPPQYWPDKTLFFNGNSGTNGGTAEIVVTNTGLVYVQNYYNAGTNGYVSLDDVRFFPVSANIPWVTATLINGWVNNNVSYSTARYYIDVDGIVHWTGAISGGTATNICTLPTAAGVDLNQEMFCQWSGAGSCAIYAGTTFLQLASYGTGGSNGFVSLDGIEYAGGTNTMYWHTMAAAMLNSWSAYGAGWNNCRFGRDSAGVIYWGGLIKGGAAGSIIEQLTPPGHRSGYQLIFNAIATAIQGRIDIAAAANNVTVQGWGTGGAATYVSLANIRYLAAA